MQHYISATISDFTHSGLSILLDASLKGVVILLIAVALVRLTHQASAAKHHLFWLLALVSLIFLPMLSALLPAWQIPILPSQTLTPFTPETEAISQIEPIEQQFESFNNRPFPLAESTLPPWQPDQFTPSPLVNPEVPKPKTNMSSSQGLHWSVWVLLIWMVGAVFVLTPLLVGIVGLGRIPQKCKRITDGPLAEMLNNLARQFRLTQKVTLLQGAAPGRLSMPMAWGIIRPIILLPFEADKWPQDQLRITLLHELAHTKRWDWLIQLFAHLVCSLYWFNPLVWLAKKQLRIERERACDDLILRSGFSASDYAGHLLAIVRK
ncbi:M56 family metallopeptidase, partial [Planctomycetota bacterium]